MKKIVIASDSFKGCLTSVKVAEAAEQGIRRVLPNCDVVKVNVADGGEGTAEAIVGALGGRMVTTQVHDPLGRPILASYGIVDKDSLKTAVIEMSAASGLTLLKPEERNPLLTSTYGTGEIIKDAISKGCRRFLVGIGGSATNDAGTGMLSALGFVFLDAKGNRLEGCGLSLGKIAEIDETSVPRDVRQSEFIVACDVDTPFCGPDGAAYVFAPQKGATSEMVRQLDDGMRSLAEIIKGKYHTDIVPEEGAGAAGGLGGAFKVFLGAKLTKGVDMVLDSIAFDELIKGADLVITGEGKIDNQTAKGKTAAGVLRHSRAQGVPVIAIGGIVEYCPELQAMGYDGVYQVNEPDTPLSIAMQPSYAKERIRLTIAKVIKEYTERC